MSYMTAMLHALDILRRGDAETCILHHHLPIPNYTLSGESYWTVECIG